MTNLKRIIDEKGVQQRWLAEQVGVTEVSMSRYVSGDRIPKAPMAISMADALGVDVKELYGWYDEIHLSIEDALKELASLTVDYGNRNKAEIERLDRAIDMAIKALEEKKDDEQRGG